MFTRFLITVALATAAFAQPISYPVVQLQSGLRVAGTLERDGSGVYWLKTPTGSRYIVGNTLTYYGANMSPLTWTSLQPGSTVTVEYPSGDTRVVAVRGDTVTLVSSNNVITQVPISLLPAGVVSTTTVLPEPGWAILGGKTINLMPYMTFTDGITEYGTVQNKEVINGNQQVKVLTQRGENVAVPPQFINGGTSWDDVKIEERVSVDIPKGTTVQLREMYGRSAQFRTADGKLLQLPFKVVPDEVLEATPVGVRRLNGDIEVMPLSKALKEDQSRAHMILLPGVPGVSYVLGTTGVYVVEVK